MCMGGLLFVVFLYLVGANFKITRESPVADMPSEGEGLTLKNIHYTQNNPHDEVKWTLDAKEVRFSQDKQHITFTDFLLKLDSGDRPSIELKGEKGAYDKTSGEINLEGDLCGYTDNGYQIITERLLFHQKKGILETKSPVKIMGPTVTVSGHGLYYHLEKEILRILSGVTTSFEKGVIIS